MPEEVQTRTACALVYAKHEANRAPWIFLMLFPKYPVSVTTAVPKLEPIEVPFTLWGKKYTAVIAPGAELNTRRQGSNGLVFPGSREELVERALRFIAVQQIARTRLTTRCRNGSSHHSVFYIVDAAPTPRRPWATAFKLSAIKEGARHFYLIRLIEIRLESGRRTRTNQAAALHEGHHPEQLFRGTSLKGIPPVKSLAPPWTFHPAATAAHSSTCVLPDQSTPGSASSKRPLARWLTTRMSHNYRQARRNSYVQNDGLSHIP